MLSSEEMKTSYIYTVLLGIIATTFATSHNKSCIENDEVPGIAHRWLNAFATGGIGGLPDAVTNDVRSSSQRLSNIPPS